MGSEKKSALELLLQSVRTSSNAKVRLHAFKGVGGGLSNIKIYLEIVLIFKGFLCRIFLKIFETSPKDLS